MSKSARAACRQLGLDCCKGAGERLAHSSPQPQVPDLFLSPAVRLVAAAPVGALAAPRRPAPLPSAVLQGVGLHTLFAVFLI